MRVTMPARLFWSIDFVYKEVVAACRRVDTGYNALDVGNMIRIAIMLIGSLWEYLFYWLLQRMKGLYKIDYLLFHLPMVGYIWESNEI